MSASTNDLDQSIDIDEIEELKSNDNHSNTENQIIIQPSNKRARISSALTQAQKTNLSMNTEDNNKSKMSVLSTKTSNVPGTIRLLPVLVRLNRICFILFYLFII